MSGVFNTGIFVGGARDGHVFDRQVDEDAPGVHMPLPNTALPRPVRGKVQPTRAVASEFYLRSTWNAEEGVVFVFYRHESLSYADAIRMVLDRYIRR